MKELIIESIKIKNGPKGPAKVTEFDSPGQFQNPKYLDLGKLSGKSIKFTFSYTEDGVTKESEGQVDIDKGATSIDVYNFIINEINSKINT